MQTVELTQLPSTEYEDRLGRIRAKMRDRGASVGILYGNEYTPGDVQYVTGYDPQIEAVAAIVTPDSVIAIGGPEGRAMFDDQAAHGTWYNYDFFEVPFQDYGDLEFSTLNEIFEVAEIRNSGTITLLTDAKYFPYGLATAIKDAGISLEYAPDILAECRYEKTVLELALFREASRIATLATKAMIEELSPGRTELEIAAIGDSVMKREGAYSYGWDTMVLSGRRTNSMIGKASNKVIEPGELVVIGACPRYAGYASTVGRTVIAGEGSPEQKAFLDAGKHALELAAENLVAGEPARNVDVKPRDFLASKGFGPYHAYGVGHGIGFSECLELKTATRMSDYLLPAGITMSLDVGVFGNPSGLNGRFEDPYIIDHDGNTHRLTELSL